VNQFRNRIANSNRATALWQLGLGRWLFLAAVPAKALIRHIRSTGSRASTRSDSRHSAVPDPTI
jgi:hypothetical protein